MVLDESESVLGSILVNLVSTTIVLSYLVMPRPR